MKIIYLWNFYYEKATKLCSVFSTNDVIQVLLHQIESTPLGLPNRVILI